MGIFARGSSGGVMNVIRCDEQDYLIWKWRPLGERVNSTSRENSIRYGSSLRVKDGEVAVFVYKQNNGSMQDFIVGPYDDTIKTDNFPILSGIIGMAYGGDAPFQAEVYFINLAGIIQLRFRIPYFDVFDPRFMDFAVPMAAQCAISFQLVDYKAFIKLHRLVNFDLEQFQNQIISAVSKYVKSFITNAPADMQIPVLQLERKVVEISDMIEQRIARVFEADFGVKLKRFDLSAIEPDKESEGYQELRQVTAQQTKANITAQTTIGIKNMQDMQTMNAQNLNETMRIQRDEAQRAQRLQTETNFMGAHALDQQAGVLNSAATSLGAMGAMGGGGMNPAGMMTGMMMGGALGGQMAGMANQMGQNMMGTMNTPPPMPEVSFYVGVNGQQSGPFNMQQLQQLKASGQLTPQSYVWRQGMAAWEEAGKVAELAQLFMAAPTPPPMPGGAPQMPPMPAGGNS